MKKLLLIYLICTTALLAEEKTYGTVKDITITSIYDGDTFKCNIKGYPSIIGEQIGIRVLGVDCPEMKDKRPDIKAKAQEAKQYTVKRLREGKVIELVDMRRDKYFRICAVVRIDGKDLGQELIAKGLAKAYDGGTKETW
jgi:micrococcal nuclease